MRPTNLNQQRLVINIPLPLKRELFEESQKEGTSLSGYVLQILWRWKRGQNLKTGE